MAIRHEIIELLSGQADGRQAVDVRIGLGYTAVLLDDGRAGAAYTFRKKFPSGCTVFQGARPLAGKSALELLTLLDSPAPVEAALGLATANALANTTPERSLKGDVLKALRLSPSDKVGMVGFFAPLVEPLKAQVASLEIFEEDPADGIDTHPPEAAWEKLRACNVALITSTSIINHTVDRLLEAAQDCREVVLLGSSTPLSAQAFANTPVTFLSGITIHDSQGILQVISEGGGTRLFKPFVTKWNLAVGADV